MEKAIIVEKLIKDFEGKNNTRKRVLKGLSFSIIKSEKVAVLGDNNAGKTTLIKILAGLEKPTTGFVQVAGFDPSVNHKGFKQKVTLVTKAIFPLNLFTVKYLLTLSKLRYRLSEKNYKRLVDHFLQFFNAKSILSKRVIDLTLEEKYLFEILKSLLKEPEILLIDNILEDKTPLFRNKLSQFFKLNYPNTTIFYTTQILENADLADRVLIMRDGNVIYDGKLTSIIKNYAPSLLINIVSTAPLETKKLKEIGEVVRLDEFSAVISVKRSVAKLAVSEIWQMLPVTEVTIQEEPISQVIHRIFEPKKK